MHLRNEGVLRKIESPTLALVDDNIEISTLMICCTFFLLESARGRGQIDGERASLGRKTSKSKNHHLPNVEVTRYFRPMTIRGGEGWKRGREESFLPGVPNRSVQQAITNNTQPLSHGTVSHGIRNSENVEGGQLVTPGVLRHLRT